MSVPASILTARGWTAEAVDRLGLGWDGERVTIPVRDESGADVGVLRYLPGGEPKMLAGAGTTRELFPPPESIGEDEIFDSTVLLCEGEPDCVRLWSAGIAAVAVPGTQGWKPEWAARFRGPRWTVVVAFDADGGGRASGAAVARDLVAAGVDARVLDIEPLADDGFDLSDLLDGHDKLAAQKLLARFIQQAAPVEFDPADDADLGFEPGDPTVTVREFVARRDETAAEPLIEADEGNLCPAAGLMIIASKTGDGKTTLVDELTLYAASGHDYLGLRFPRPLRVLIIENEGPREAFRQKLERKLATWPHDCERVRVWDEPATWGAIRASDAGLRDRLRAVIERHAIDLVVVDTLTRFGVRGNGTPEETREFVEWLTEIGLGRDVAFLLLHHPRTRPEQGETEMEKVAGAWPPHADLIVLLQKFGGDRARLSFPKTRWANGQRPASILAFDSETETFTYVGDDEPDDRDYVAECAELMAEGDWWTVTDLRASKAKGGIGARKENVEAALTDERFESVDGEVIDRKRGSTYYRLRDASPTSGDAGYASRISPDQEDASPSPSRERKVDGDASSGRDASADPDEVERLAQLAIEMQDEVEW